MYNAARDVPECVKQFVITVRRKAMNDMAYASASPASVGMMAGTIGKHLKNKENRIPVIQAITGLALLGPNMKPSSKRLTQQYVSVIIEEVQNDTRCIALIEELIKNFPDRTPKDLFPWESPKVTVPFVRKATL